MNFAGKLVTFLSPTSALIDASDGKVVGRGNLRELIVHYGAAMRQSGLSIGDKILIGCDLTPETILAYFGAIYAGLVVVPVDVATFKDKLDVLLEISEARAIWTRQVYSFENLRSKELILLNGDLSENSIYIQPAQVSETDLAALMATSGSTGIPRFVMVTHGNMIANTEAIIRSQDLDGTEEYAMLVMPINYVFGASILHTHLYVGGSVVLDRRFMFPDKVLKAIDTYNCTTFAGVPSVYQLLLRNSSLGKIPMKSLRRFLQAGGPLPPDNIRKILERMPSVNFYVMYGQTEATARISCLDPKELEEKIGSVGRALDNLIIRVVNEDEKDLAVNQTGEITVKGPSISPGYWKDPERTSQSFQNGWLKTGDLGYLDQEGIIWITGRKGQFIKMRGFRVSLSEVEARVISVFGVSECGAVGISHPQAGEAFILFVVAQQKADLEKVNLEKNIRKSLPIDWVCQHIEFVSELPKTSNGKLSRAKLDNFAKSLNLLNSKDNK